MGCVETHLPESKLRKMDSEARGKGLRMIANPARPSGNHRSEASVDKANEGGEILFSKKHLQVESLAEARLKALKAPGS